MTFCPKCGAECPPDSVFCWKCGSKILKYPQKSQKQFDLSRLKAIIIPSAIFAIIILIILVFSPWLQDPCKRVICDNECRGNTLWKMKCIQGECVPDYPIEKDSEICGYDPCKNIVCDNTCLGTDLWKMKCLEGECVRDYMIEKNSTECGYEPPPTTPPTSTPTPEPELPGIIGWEGDTPIIDWRYADQYYGQYVIVEGTIVDTYNSGKACFLNFHPDWERYFTAVIFASDFHKFPNNPEVYYKGKKVRVRGVIQEYEGKPEIILEDPSQIEIIG
jgi:ribosomal protein L40E